MVSYRKIGTKKTELVEADDNGGHGENWTSILVKLAIVVVTLYALFGVIIPLIAHSFDSKDHGPPVNRPI